MYIDLHVHTAERSPCATVKAVDQIKAAMRAGLDGIAITDHDRLVPPESLREWNKSFAPFKIFTGIEVEATQEHWIVLGIHDPRLETRDWRYPDLLDFVRDHNGYIILAHPFRHSPDLRVDLDAFTPDGIEVESSNTPASREPDIRALATCLGLVLFSNSDAHNPGTIGKFRTRIPRPARDDQELLDVLEEMKTPRLEAEK